MCYDFNRYYKAEAGSDSVGKYGTEAIIVREEVEAKTDYLSKISHEIRTTMGALVGLIRMARQKYDDAENLDKNLESIEKTIEYMAALVSDISEASRLERDVLDQVKKPFSLEEVMDNIHTLILGRATEAGLTFEVSHKDDFAPKYIGNKTSIQQILVNFLNNSLKYTPKGGALSLKVFEDENVKVKDNEVSLFFVVSDTGNGIKKDFIPKLFDPFTREQVGDANEASSMGLGLSIAQKLIQSMKGDIQVESKVGQGSTFTIHLTVERDDGRLRYQVVPEYNNVKLAGRNVLLAENNPLNRTILGAILNSEDITYVEAEDGEKAVRLFTESPEGTFDCVLMDMRMPKMDGIRATMAIRASERMDAKTVPIIAVSANGFKEDVEQAKEAGVNEYTTKPIDKDRLFATMKQLLR